MLVLPVNQSRVRKGVSLFLLAAGVGVILWLILPASNASSNKPVSNPAARSSMVPRAPVAPAGSTYTWVGGTPVVTTDWTIPTNWSPQRLTPASTDNLVFDGAGTPSPLVTNVPTQTIGTLSLINGVALTINAASGSQTLTISGATGDDLSVLSGTSLTVASANALNVSISSGSKGTIGGSLILQDGAHKVVAADLNGMIFQSGSIFTTAAGFNGNPFGAGTDGAVSFQSGSSAFFNAGSDPFGGAGHSVASFNLGSSQTFTAASAFSSDGRTYGNLTLDGNQIYVGSGTGLLTVFNTLTIASGSTLTLSSSAGGDLNLLGNISIAGTLNTNGRTVKFQGGNATQNITTPATFGDVSIAKIGGSVKLGGALTINGALQFDGTVSAMDVLDLNQNTLNLTGTIGGTSSSTSNGLKGDSTGATLNITGTGALGTLKFVSGSQNLKSLSVNRTSSGKVTLGSNLTIGDASVGSLTLTNGIVDVGSNTLSLAAFPAITRTNGYVNGNLQKTFANTGPFTFTVGTANGYSPVDANVTAGAGNSLTVKAVQGAQPNITGNALQRYWTIGNTGPVTADLTFHYFGSDVVGTEANYKLFKYDGSFTTFSPSTLDTVNHLATLNGVSSFSDWTLADPATVFGTVRFESAPYADNETNSDHIVNITVSRSGGSNGAVDVNYGTSDGTATAGSDYVTASGTLHWNNGEMGNKTFDVTVKGDTTYEADETVNLTLSNLQGGATFGSPSTTTLTILNDDAPPATLTVNTTDDVDNGVCLASHCSLREAINAANFDPDANTIVFDSTVFSSAGGPYTITLTGALPDISTDMSIAGPAAASVKISGNDSNRVFTIDLGTVTISNLTITNGQASFGGGIFNLGNLTISNCTFTNNYAQGGEGGAIDTEDGTVAIVNTTISGNRADTDGGGLLNCGNSMTTLTNVTITDNRADADADSIGAGGGIGQISSNPITINNSIVAGNVTSRDTDTTSESSDDVNSQIFSGSTVDPASSNNLIGADTGLSDITNGTNGNQIGTAEAPLNPLLGPLANNGGPTMTQALRPESPAINAGSNTFVTNPPFNGSPFTDQRGTGFPRIVNTTVDIGAFEANYAISATAGSGQSAMINSPFATQLQATVTESGVARSGIFVTFTPPASGASGVFSGPDDTETVTTNGSGIATASVFTANGIAGSYNVIAGIAANQPTASFALTNTRGDQTITFNAIASKTFGDADFQVNPTASSSLSVSLVASGSCTVTSPSPGTVHLTGAGSCTITAKQAGDSNYNAAPDVPQTFSISKATTSTAVSSSVNPSDFGESVTFTATVTSGAGTPTGTVQFKDGAGPITCANAGGQTLSGGVATCQIATLSAGPHTITADYSGDTNFNSSSGTLSGGQVVRAQPSLSINDVSATEGDSGTKNFVFTVTLSAASHLQVKVDFATANGTATTADSDYQSNSGTLTFNSGDTAKTITVLVNGDQKFEPNETFFVNLTNPVNATISDNQGLGTITNDDAQGGIISFSQSNYNVNESDGFVTVTVNRTGDISSAATVDYATDDTGAPGPCATFNGFASSRCDFTTALGTLKFAPNEGQKTLVVLVNRDGYNVEIPSESFSVKLSNLTGGSVFGVPSTATVSILNSGSPAPNAIDDAGNFVRQHYHDFLNREPDQSGLDFWTNQITSCGSNAQCIEVRRINVSASFFLSIEFQQSGFLVERIYKVAFADAMGASTLGTNHQLAVPVVRFDEFLRGTQRIGQGLIVLAPGWEQVLENNKQAYTQEFVQSTRFINAFPTTMTPAQFVDKLNQNAGNVLSASERTTAINLFGGSSDTTNLTARAQALRQVAEDQDLVNAEFNRAFVLMQYFGYLRRNPNDPQDTDYTGYDFWLTKLNQFNGNYINAEMVKAFLSSAEYRQRFGP